MKLSKKLAVVGLVVASVVGIGLTVSPETWAATCSTGTNCLEQGLNSVSNGSRTDVGGLIKSIVNALLFALGAIAVVMIVIGGIRYTTSNGDSSQVTSAKNTIMYAVIGLIIAIMAYSIVNFVIQRLATTPATNTPTQNSTVAGGLN